MNNERALENLIRNLSEDTEFKSLKERLSKK